MSSDSKTFADKVGTAVRRNSPLAPKMPPASPAEPQEQSTAHITRAGIKRWATNDTSYWGAPETRNGLPAGYYRATSHPHLGPMLLKQSLKTDGLLELPDDATAAILAEFETFWRVEDSFRAYGFLWKRGLLLWGPPGGGKTSAIQLMIARLVGQYDGIVVNLEDPSEAAGCLQLIRSIEPKRPMVCVMEDFDALVERHGENQYLSILDGEAQVDNCVFVATTNYPERLDKRFVDRPSRFDTIMLIGMPSAAARRAYFQAKDPALAAGEVELETWVRLSVGFSLAHLKEMIVAVRCFGQALESVVTRLEEMHERQPTSEDTANMKAGFLTHRNGHAHQ